MSIQSDVPRNASRGLLDTNMVIHLPRLGASQLPELSAISTVTIAELAAGVHTAHESAARANRVVLLQNAERLFEPLPFDIAAAHAYGRIWAAVRAIGRSSRARTADLQIAAIAASQDLPLYTTNANDFAGLDELVEVVPVVRPPRE